MRVYLAHVRWRTVEYAREPFAIVPTLAFPLMITAFFILPNLGEGYREHAFAVVLMLSFAMIAFFNFGAGTAEERRLPWDAFLRTLPLAPWTALAARLTVGIGFAIVGALPALALVVWQGSTTLPSERWLPLAAAVLLGAVALTGLGLTIGNALPYKAAISVANIVFLPMAFVGGLFIPPQALPGWASAIGWATPMRPWVEASHAAVAGQPARLAWWLALAAWAVALCALARWAYAREEQRRYS